MKSSYDLKKIIKKGIWFVLSIFPVMIFGQDVELLSQFQLESEIHEISGLELHNDHIICFNDSGNESIIYQLKDDYKVDQKHKLDITNKDWEDITYDGSHYYLADVGNNRGNRKDLTIYKLDTTLQPISKIELQYKDQRSFKKDTLNEFDCEAVVSYGKELVLFSKNRKYLTTELYSVNKNETSQILAPINQFDAKALITGGDYHPETKTLALIGYTYERKHYLYLIENFDPNLELNPRVIELVELEGQQAEGIKFVAPNTLLISSEGEKNYSPAMYKVEIKNGQS